jgi:hypothetical protein
MDYTQYLQAKVIRTGCEWKLKIKVISAAVGTFPPQARFQCQFRAENADGPVLANLTTDNGQIVRVDDDNNLELTLKASDSVDWTVEKVVADIVRIDLSQRQHLGFDLEIPVKRTITRP